MIFVAAAAVLLSGCVKEGSRINEDTSFSNEFTCTIEDDEVTKTTLDSDKNVNWESDDKIRINGALYKLSYGEGGANATFAMESGSSPSAPFYAFYANGATADTWNSTDKTYTLPSSYSYEEYSATGFKLPMYAYSGKALSLEFKNICGVVKLAVSTSCNLSQVSDITVSSDAQLNGAFTSTSEGVMTFKDKTLSDEDKTVKIEFTNPYTLTGSDTYFYIPVPPGSHKLTLTVNSGSATNSITMTNSVSFIKNKIYAITFPAYSGGDAENAI